MKYVVNETKLSKLMERWKSPYGMLYNQSEKAAIIGVSQAVVSRLEKGSKRFGELKAHHYIALCNGLGINPAETLKMEGE